MPLFSLSSTSIVFSPLSALSLSNLTLRARKERKNSKKERERERESHTYHIDSLNIIIQQQQKINEFMLGVFF